MAPSAIASSLRRPALVPTHCSAVSDIPLDSEEGHAARCEDEKNCKRCFFWKAYHGHACKNGTATSAAPASAWKNRFTFPYGGRRVCWVSVRQVSWACNTVYSGKCGSKMSRGESTEVTATALMRHQQSQEHTAAVAALGKDTTPATDDARLFVGQRWARPCW